MYRENCLTDIYKAAFIGSLFVLFCTAKMVYSEGAPFSSINEIELRAQARGVMLVISGSGPINVSGKTDELEKLTSKYSEVRISIKNATSALGANSFNCPPELPIKDVTLKETPYGVDLSVKMRGVMNGPVQIRGGGNQIRILLSKDEYPQISWIASTGRKTVFAPADPDTPAIESKQKEAAPPPNVARNRAAAPVSSDIMSVTVPSGKPRSLNNIRVLQRDRTVSLNFDFSDEPVVSVNKAGDSLVIHFSNTVSKLGSQRAYNVPGNLPYSSVRIRQEKAADKSSNVIAVVKLNKKFAPVSPVGMHLDNQYALYAASADSARVFLWNALEGVQSSVNFAQIEAEPIDMQKMENRAAKDIEKSSGALFPITDGIVHAGQTGASENAAAMSAGLPVQIAPRTEVPQASFENEIDGSIPDSEVTRESADGDLVRYRVYGRDPFVPLVRDQGGVTDLPKVENLRLVGVLEDTRERIALLEDFTNENRAFALRSDDMVEYGKVLRIHRDRVVFLMSDFGVARSYTLRLAKSAQ